MKKNRSTILILFIIVILILFTILIINNNYYKESFTNNNISVFKYYDENNKLIDNMKEEYIEQIQADKYIEPDSKVLELGARYGTVSCIINSKLNNKNNQVSVEPDSKVWDCLEKNMKNNSTNFNIVKGFISSKPMELEGDGYGLTFKDVNSSSISNYSLKDIEEKYKINFDTLVADCEGCLERFFDENKSMYKKLKLVIMEEDQPQKCNYNKIKEELKNNNFSLLETNNNVVERSVWKKNSIY